MNSLNNKLNLLQKSTLMNVLFILLTFYLATSTIYWIPSFPYTILKPIKIGIIISVIILFFWKFFIYRYRKMELPYILSIPILLLLIFFVPFMIISLNYGKTFSDSFNYYLNLFFGFLTSLMVYNNFHLIKSKKWIYLIPFLTTIFISIPPFTNFIFNFPEWKVPIKAEDVIDELFWYSGFNFSRTGWSVSLSLFVPLAILVFNDFKKNSTFHFLYFILLVSPILAAQSVSGGRGGLLASLISILITFIVFFGKRYLIIFISIAFLIIQKFKNEIFIAMRINDISGNSNSIENLSSNRFSQYKYFYKILFDNPIFGWGYKGSEAGVLKYTGNSFEMHNTLLRVFIDHGIIFGTSILFLIIQILYITIKLFKNKNTPRIIHVNSCILISTFVASMFEPNVIFGGFQLCAFWWVALGYNLKYYKLNF